MGGVDVAYLDFAKAFDTVSHPKLIQKLRAYGVSGNLLRWIESFLIGRTHCVRIDGHTSTLCTVTSGVPQGSVIGPLLFLIYINDMPSVIAHSDIHIFADDSKLSFKVNNLEDKARLSEDLGKLFQWANVNQMSLALEKCAVTTYWS